MNAISPPQRHQDEAERAGHQLTVCRELADLAMELARAAARRTLQAWQAQEEAEPANADKAAGPARRGPNPGLLFLRFSSAVRQAIALENRIAAGAAPVRAKRASGPSLDAPRDSPPTFGRSHRRPPGAQRRSPQHRRAYRAGDRRRSGRRDSSERYVRRPLRHPRHRCRLEQASRRQLGKTHIPQPARWSEPSSPWAYLLASKLGSPA